MVTDFTYANKVRGTMKEVEGGREGKREGGGGGERERETVVNGSKPLSYCTCTSILQRPY